MSEHKSASGTGAQRTAPLVLTEVDGNPETSFIRGYRQFWPFLRPYAAMGVLGILLTVPVGALDAVVASFLKPFMDQVMIEHNSYFAGWVPVIIVLFCLVQGCFIYASALVNGYVGEKISLRIKKQLYHKLVNCENAFFSVNSSGGVLYRFEADATTASSGLISNIKLFLTRFFSSLSLIVVMIYQSWQLSLVAVGVLVFLFWPMSVVRRQIKKIVSQSMGSQTEVLTVYNETTAGQQVIKLFGLKERMEQRFEALMTFLFRMSMKNLRETSWLSPVMHLVTAIGVAGVLYYGLHLIITGTITSGGFVAFLAALLMLYTPVKSIGNNFISVQQALLALDRIYQVLALPSYEEEDGVAGAEGTAAGGRQVLREVRRGVEFDAVHFAYGPMEPEVLRGISFRMEVGRKVALVGSSGGGKSTLCALLARLYDPTAGCVRIDGTDIREFTLSSLRSQIAMVFQDNFLFEGTIRDNLLCGREDADDAALHQALRDAYLEEFIRAQPEGLDTRIGERGLTLSGGQKQRLAIARAMLRDAPVVVLDEATSALDNQAEKEVQKAMARLSHGRTTLVIAHRLSTVEDADLILVIADGQIAERGTHQELLGAGGIYAALYKVQYAGDGTVPEAGPASGTPQAAKPEIT